MAKNQKTPKVAKTQKKKSTRRKNVPPAVPENPPPSAPPVAGPSLHWERRDAEPDVKYLIEHALWSAYQQSEEHRGSCLNSSRDAEAMGKETANLIKAANQAIKNKVEILDRLMELNGLVKPATRGRPPQKGSTLIGDKKLLLEMPKEELKRKILEGVRQIRNET